MVDQVEGVPRSRRAMLTAAAAAGVATVAAAITRPLPVSAATDDNAAMYIGGQYTDVSTTTFLRNATNGNIVLHGKSTSSGVGIYGESASNIGVFGTTPAGHGVYGTSANGVGARGSSTSYIGVLGTSSSAWGVYGTSNSGTAVYGESTSGTGAVFVTSATNQQAVIGWARGGSAGVHGYVGGVLAVPAPRANTAVLGNADGNGTGGYFSSDSGNAGQFTSASGNAIRVEGKASFSRSGRSNVPANKAYVDVTVPGGLAATAFVIATLQLPRTGVYVASARINYPVAGKVRIQLNKVASTTASTPVGWFVVG